MTNRMVPLLIFAVVGLCDATAQIKVEVQGSTLTQPQKASVRSTASPQNSKKLSNQDVIDLVSLKVSDDIIINSIRTAEVTEFDTSVAGLKLLKEKNVSDAVIRAMMNPRAVGDGASTTKSASAATSETVTKAGTSAEVSQPKVALSRMPVPAPAPDVFPGLRLGDSKDQVRQVLKDHGWGKWKCGRGVHIFSNPGPEHCVFASTNWSTATFSDDTLTGFSIMLSKKECGRLQVAEWMESHNGKVFLYNTSPDASTASWLFSGTSASMIKSHDYCILLLYKAAIPSAQVESQTQKPH